MLVVAGELKGYSLPRRYNEKYINEVFNLIPEAKYIYVDGSSGWYKEARWSVSKPRYIYNQAQYYGSEKINYWLVKESLGNLGQVYFKGNERRSLRKRPFFEEKKIIFPEGRHNKNVYIDWSDNYSHLFYHPNHPGKLCSCTLTRLKKDIGLADNSEDNYDCINEQLLGEFGSSLIDYCNDKSLENK